MAETTAEPIKEQPIPPPKDKEKADTRVRAGKAQGRANLGEGDAGEDTWTLLKSIPDNEWRDVYQLYLYRCEPYTDRKVTGNDNFIMKYTQPIDQQGVMEEFGSGKYLLILNQFNPQTRQSKAVYSHYFRIMNLNFPPKLPLGEWINDARNKDWSWAKPMIEAAEAKRLQQQQINGLSTGMDQATQMFQAAVAAVKTLRPDQSPEEQHSLAGKVIESMEKSADRMLAMANPAQFMGLVEKILSVNKSDGGGLLQLVTAQLTGLREELSEERKFNRDLLTKINTPEPRRSLKEELGDVKEIAGMFRGGGGASQGTDWAGVAVTVAKDLLHVAGNIAQAVILSKGKPPVAHPPATVNVNPQLPPAAPQTAPQAQPQSANPPAGVTQEQKEQMQMAQTLEQINQQFGWLFDLVAPHLADFFRKSDGVEFREWFREEHGRFAYDQVRQYPPEIILGAIELRKQIAAPHVQQYLNQLQPPEKAAQFLQEFLSDIPLEEDEDEPGADVEQSPSGKDF